MELLGRQETWNITYDHALGEIASFFYAQIRDHKRIWGDRKSTRLNSSHT